MLGRAGSVFCLGCDSDGGVTCAGAGPFAVSGAGWGGRSVVFVSGDLVSLEREAVDEACFRC